MASFWKILIAVTVLAFAALAHYLLLTRNSPQDVGKIPLATSTISAPGIVDSSGKGYEIKTLPLPQKKEVRAPNVATLSTGIVPKNDFEKLVLSNLEAARAALLKVPDSYYDWLAAGIALGQLERYEAARDVFVYTAVTWPTEPVSHGNLGSLYHLYLKDFPKSEAAYERAIALNPEQPGWYRGLFELYRYSYKQKTDAWEQTLQQGIEATRVIDLMALLASRYAELGRLPESVAAYDTAITEAEKKENSAAVDALIAERASVRARIK